MRHHKKWKQFGYQAQQQDLQIDLNAKFDLSFKSNNTKLNVLKNNAKKYKIRVKIKGKPRSASEGRLQLDGDFLKNEAIHCYKHKSHCQIEPMKITLPSYCEPTQIKCRGIPNE